MFKCKCQIVLMMIMMTTYIALHILTRHKINPKTTNYNDNWSENKNLTLIKNSKNTKRERLIN